MKYLKPLSKVILTAGLLTSSHTLLALDTAYPLCYFKNPSNTVWSYWGLKPDNSWFSMTGTFTVTPHSGIKKFFTSTSYSSIAAACDQARIYYNVPSNAPLYAIFSKVLSTDNNMPIVLGGGELFPQY